MTADNTTTRVYIHDGVAAGVEAEYVEWLTGAQRTAGEIVMTEEIKAALAEVGVMVMEVQQ